MKKYIFAVLALIIFNGCAGYKVPICTEKNRVDVPNLEGKFSIQAAMIQNNESAVIRQEFNISRMSKGYYHSQNKQFADFSTCEIEGQVYAEAFTFAALSAGTYLNAFKLNRNGDGSFDLVMLGVDTRILKAKNIPYEVVEIRKSLSEGGDCETKPGDKIQCNVSKQVVVDNSKLSAEELIQILDPSSFQLKWTPEQSRLVSLSDKPGK